MTQRRSAKSSNTGLRALRSRAARIKMLLLDVDGVLTDGRIILDNQGNELKAFHVRDGHGIKLAQRAGIAVGIITGRKARVVNVRAKELGIKEVHQGAKEKILVYESLLSRHSLTDAQVAYVGDDVVDLDIMRRVGFAACVADADPSVVPVAHLVTRAEGGRGAVREVINFILESRGALRIA